MDQDSREDGVQEALNMLDFMGLTCEKCDGRGYTNSPCTREDIHGREYDEYTNPVFAMMKFMGLLTNKSPWLTAREQIEWSKISGKMGFKKL